MRELVIWAALAVLVVAIWAYAQGAGWLLWPLFWLFVVVLALFVVFLLVPPSADERRAAIRNRLARQRRKLSAERIAALRERI